MSDHSRFCFADSSNPLWSETARGHDITVVPERLINKTTKIFTIGSCFARRVREALRSSGYDVYPNYFQLPVNGRQRPSRLPRRDNINHYDTFTIRQEIELALRRANYAAEGFWSLDKSEIVRIRWTPRLGTPSWDQLCQDPYRRLIFAADMPSLIDLSSKTATCIAEGLAAADVIIITLGLTECWKNKRTGLFVCEGPANETDPRYQLLDFHSSSFAENYTNLSATIDAIRSAYPLKRVVLTVSPVPLGRTWTGEDVVVANMASKSTLRAVAAQVCRENQNVIYWPSYEFAARGDIYEPDGRHVRKEAVQHIVDAFLQAHAAETVTPEQASPDKSRSPEAVGATPPLP